MHSNLTTTLHGVFLSIFGVGVLITGESGIGKSELALSLINRGHQLIADDAPIFSKTSNNTIQGKCPDILKNFLEIYGVGIFNIAKLYGDKAILTEQNLAIVIQLQQNKNSIHSSPFSAQTQTIKILDIEFLQYIFPISSYHHLEIIIETLIRNYLVKQNGYDANQHFLQQHQQFIIQGASTNSPADLATTKMNEYFPQPALAKENLG